MTEGATVSRTEYTTDVTFSELLAHARSYPITSRLVRVTVGSGDSPLRHDYPGVI